LRRNLSAGDSTTVQRHAHDAGDEVHGRRLLDGDDEVVDHPQNPS
jgi:hypothetical protein